MKAGYLLLALTLILVGNVLAESETPNTYIPEGYDAVDMGFLVGPTASWDDGYDSYGYGDSGNDSYADLGGSGCCCAPMFALIAVGAFAFQRQ